MIHFIIFSYNRAMQLDALLKSIYSNIINAKDIKISVLYNTSNSKFDEGYNNLIRKYASKQIFYYKEAENKNCLLKEYGVNILNPFIIRKLILNKKTRKAKTNFRSILLEILSKISEPSVCFLTDDSIFYNKITNVNGIIDWILKKPTERQFSLRLGKNINITPDTVNENIENFIEWDFLKNAPNTNWGYFFSVDGHIYSTKYIKYVLQRNAFANPNTLEGNVNYYIKTKKKLNIGRCYQNSILISFPINIVQNVVENEHLNISTESLNEHYLNGYQIEYKIPEVITRFQQYPKELEIKSDFRTVNLKQNG